MTQRYQRRAMLFSDSDRSLFRAMPHLVEVIRDAIYFEQLARVARMKADASGDPYLAVRLREAAVKHERKARQLRRSGS